MQTITSLDPAALNLKPLGADHGADADAYLKGLLAIGGRCFHVDFIEVTVSDVGAVAAVIEAFASNIDALYEFTGANPEVLDFKERTYVVLLYPFSE